MKSSSAAQLEFLNGDFAPVVTDEPMLASAHALMDAQEACRRREDSFHGGVRTPAADVEHRRRGNERNREDRKTMNGIQAAEVIGDRLLRINEVADCLRSSDKTVRRLICSGKLRSLKVRGLRLVRASDLRALVEGATY